jgi:DNA-directed RNA polymerase specialized sigma24 family protein
VAGHGVDVHEVSAFERLFADHARDVLAYVLRRADHATAEDVVAEVFAVAWRRRERVPDREPVLWLYAVARRVLANERRGAQRRAALTAALGPLARQRAAPAPGPAGSNHAVHEALAALRPADREILMLTAWEGLDGHQVALVLGCSPQAVHTRLHRARARLAAQLRPGDDTPLAPSDTPCSEVTP